MQESIIIYLGLMFVMMGFAWVGSKSRHYRWLWAGLASLSFGVVMGIRMRVGVDFPMYYDIYELTKAGVEGWGFERWEPAFKILYIICGSQYLHYSIPFGIVAFLQIFLIFYGLRYEQRIWTYIPLTLMLAGYFISYNNIMRHMVAFSIFVCAIPFLAERKYWKYLLCILAAACFHKSALVLIILPAIYSWCQQVFSRIWVQLIWVGIGLVIMNIDFVQNIFDALSIGMVLLGYDGYTQTSYAEFDKEATLGVGFAVIIVVNIILVLYSRQMKSYFNRRSIAIMYDMYFFGFFVKLAFLRMFLLQRLNYYFISFEFIIAALTLYYLREKKNWISFAVIIVLYLALFIAKLQVKDDGSVLYHSFLD